MHRRADARDRRPQAGAGQRATCILKIRRYDPERDDEPHWERYEVPVEPGDRLLDALH